jgi:hypothetical protein
MTSFAVLERWETAWFRLRLVTDDTGEIRLEYQSILYKDRVWRKDTKLSHCDDDTFNRVVPVFT